MHGNTHPDKGALHGGRVVDVPLTEVAYRRPKVQLGLLLLGELYRRLRSGLGLRKTHTHTQKERKKTTRSATRLSKSRELNRHAKKETRVCRL